jgi:hypothetical protein
MNVIRCPASGTRAGDDRPGCDRIRQNRTGNKQMKIISRALFALLALAAAGPAAAATASSATFLVVHGLPGSNVASGLTPDLPVDVLVGGKYCLLSNFTFGTIAGPFNVPAGTYPIAISLANPLSPCSNAAVISATVNLAGGSTNVLVATQSTSGTPTAEAYALNTTPVPKSLQRFMTIHAADAPAVEVTGFSSASDEAFSFSLAPGKDVSKQIRAVTTGFLVAQASGVNIPPVAFTAGDRALILTVAVGNASTDSVQLLTKVIPDLF